MTITIHLLDFAERGMISARQAASLPTLQQQRFAELKSTRAISYFWSRTFLLFLLKKYGSNWVIEERKDLPPLLSSTDEDTPPKFSVSHSGGMLAIAILPPGANNSANIGLDIERLDPQRSVAAAELFCNADQLAAILDEAPSQQADSMIELWTQKEAWFKKLNTPILNPQIKNLRFTAAKAEHANMFTAKLDNAFYLSLACSQGAPNLVCYRLERSEGKKKIVPSKTGFAIDKWASYRHVETT